MEKIALLFILFFYCQLSTAQGPPDKYIQLRDEAAALYKKGEYKASAYKYEEAFNSWDGRSIDNDLYNASCSYALAGIKDSAFKHLNHLASFDFIYNFDWWTIDKDLNSLHDDPRWEEVINQLKANYEKYKAGFNQDFVAFLDSIYIDDQTDRLLYRSYRDNFGLKSPQFDSLNKVIHYKDSINLVKIEAFLDEHGWLSPDSISENGSQTIFLVIQHTSNIEVQVKHLPTVRKAVADGYLNGSNLALLEDRVALKLGKKQLYGTQIGYFADEKRSYVLPVEDPKNINKRRAEVGLPAIQEYVSIWNFEWDLKQYKKDIKKHQKLKKAAKRNAK
ncbi:hypothetical protein K6119_09490 [Paracrocinitomix mangrovi]|uniref:DUF6624 domain-containing protein n=1 Tax=Paracrocinitomix mangrovi TaxID=2862509 RepID=UPI001C8D979B|nr:DUF6624 domain-containing protein [Paracrocinitomix mangrovi]UKN03723.1 hypothetical protein K6119_09490 [Paracrocinitomix mangrovi]